MAATRSISTLVAIEGDKTYKQALTSINAELKAHISRMKLVTAEYATNANSEEALSRKSEALRNVIAAQQKKVETLTAAMRNAQSAQSRWAETADQTQRELTDTTDAVSKLDERSRSSAETYRSYQKQLQNAQAELKRLETSSYCTSSAETALKAEIDRLKTSMSTLEKQTGGAAKSNAELLDRQEQLNRKLETVNGKATTAGNAVRRYQTQINNAKVEIIGLDNELKKNEQYLAEAKSSADHCATSIDRLGREIQQAGTEAQSGGEAFSRVGESVDALSSVLLAAGVQRGLKKIADALQDCIQVSADFSYTMSTVRAVTGASEEEMAGLSTQAKEYAASTIYFAQDIADAYATMGRAGFTASEMMASLPGVVALASASGEGLADVTSTMADNLTAFGDGADQAARYADVLAQSAAESNTTVANLSDAFTMAASTAGTLGYNIEDVSVWLAAMANQGIKGSMAGSAVTTALTRMAGGTDAAVDALEKLGVSMFDAHGNARELNVFLDDLRTAFSGLTQEEASNYATTLAGIRGKKALLALVNTSTEDWNELTEAINNSTGAAEQMADIQLDNYSGQVQLLESAAEELKITIGDQLTPALGDLSEAGTDVLTWVSELLKAHESLVPVIGGAVTALGVFVGTVTVATAAVKLFQAASGTLGSALGVIGLVAGAVGALAAAFVSAANDSDSTAAKVEASASRWQEAKSAYEEAANSMNTESASVYALVSELYNLADGTKASAGEQERIQAILSELNDLVPELALNYDALTNSMSQSQEKVLTYYQMQHGQDKLTAEREKYIVALEEQKVAEEALSQALEEQKLYQAELATARAKAAELGEDPYSYTLGETYKLDEANHAVDEAQKHFNEMTAAVDSSKAALDVAGEEVDEYTAAWNNFSKAEADAELEEIAKAAKGASGSAEELSAAYDDLSSQFGQIKENGSVARAELTKHALEALALKAAVAELEEGYGSFVRAAGVDLEGLAGYLSENGISAEEWGKTFEENLDKVTNGFSEINTDLGLSLSEIRTNLENNALAYSTWQTNIDTLMQAAVASQDENAIRFVEAVQGMGIGAADQVAAMAENMPYTFNELVPVWAAGAASAVEAANREYGYGVESATESGTQTGAAYAEGLTEGKDETGTSTQDLIQTAIETVDSMSERMRKSGETVAEIFASGIAKKKKAAEDIAQAMSSGAASKADRFNDFRMSGLHCAEGLADGILAGTPRAVSAGVTLIKDVLAAMRKVSGEHSPWKTTQRSGKFAAEGLAIGLKRNTGSVIAAALEVSRAAIRGLSLEKIAAPTADTLGALAYYKSQTKKSEGNGDNTSNTPAHITTNVYLGNRQVAEVLTDQVITEINGRVVQAKRGKGR